jgi:hypothetical protein
MRRRRAGFTRAKCEAVAGVVAAGSSFGSAENRGQFLPSQRCAGMPSRLPMRPGVSNIDRLNEAVRTI